jgi:HEPN domain-containing protein
MKNETAGWVFFANNDMLAAKTLIEHTELAGEIAFLCQQAIEKYFKGYLVEQGKDIQKIHDLLKIYLEVKDTHDWNLDVDLLEEISRIYTVTRYPGNIGIKPDGCLPTIEEARGYFDFAKKSRLFLRSWSCRFVGLARQSKSTSKSTSTPLLTLLLTLTENAGFSPAFIYEAEGFVLKIFIF